MAGCPTAGNGISDEKQSQAGAGHIAARREKLLQAWEGGLQLPWDLTVPPNIHPRVDQPQKLHRRGESEERGHFWQDRALGRRLPPHVRAAAEGWVGEMKTKMKLNSATV